MSVDGRDAGQSRVLDHQVGCDLLLGNGSEEGHPWGTARVSDQY